MRRTVCFFAMGSLLSAAAWCPPEAYDVYAERRAWLESDSNDSELLKALEFLKESAEQALHEKQIARVQLQRFMWVALAKVQQNQRRLLP